jgi:uncharacterized NAD(P)/FAD-binding protein YdhS
MSSPSGSASERKRVVIVGGGFSGAAVAYHLVRLQSNAEISVVEPRERLGGGLAYDTADPAHRINVPSSKMSLRPEVPDHFDRWLDETGALESDPEATVFDGTRYPCRSVFGDYVASQVQPLVSEQKIAHVKDRVMSISRDGGQWWVGLSSGSNLGADLVVLATTHPKPRVPSEIDLALQGSARLIADATRAGALDTIPDKANVLIVGSGLTMADVVASLDRKGHSGKIAVVSRHGLLSRPHARVAAEPYGEFAGRCYTALQLLRHVRQAVANAQTRGIPWQSVFDALRSQAQSFWPLMTIPERRKLVRHLRTFWDVHRFRIAPQVDDVIGKLAAAGRFQLIAGRIASAQARPGGIVVGLARRHRLGVEHRVFDTVIITTGPDHANAISTEPHLASLYRAGLIEPDVLGLGLSCDRQGRALDKSGDIVPALLIAGPLARGTFGELMGLPQVAEYAAAIAATVSSELTGGIEKARLLRGVA